MEHIPEQQIDSIIKLFVTWNNHNNDEVGQRMVQRFDRWFDCLATLRLGECKIKNTAHLKICESFGSVLSQIQKPKELVPSAYQLFTSELDKYTDHPKVFEMDVDAGTMVQKVWPTLSKSHQNLLLENYMHGRKVANNEMLELLEARYALKKAIFTEFHKNNSKGIDWVLTSTTPDRDLIPMPLFESGVLNNAVEQQYFECWLINAPIICLDVQEFAPFAHAIKEGAIASEMELNAAPTPTPVTDGQTSVAPEIKDTPSFESTPMPTVENNDNVNSIAKPIVLMVLTAVALIGIWVLLSGGGS